MTTETTFPSVPGDVTEWLCSRCNVIHLPPAGDPGGTVSIPWPPGGFAEPPGGFRNLIPRHQPAQPAPDAVAWLRQQIGVKLAAARGLACTGSGHWGVTCNGDYDYTIAGTADVLPKSNEAVADCWGEAVAYFIADNDPQSVIALCEAELAILATLEEDLRCGARTDLARGGQIALWVTCKRLATAYRHRPGYAEHWGSSD